MKFLADENIDKPIVTRLRADGYIVFYVAEIEPSLPDNKVIELSNKEGALLLTADKDFGELVFRQGLIMQGVILIRLSGLPSGYKAELVSNVIKEHMNELSGNFTVISSKVVRIRRRRK
jgi:predicted nuclease of predicted toxin-antitoxin system